MPRVRPLAVAGAGLMAAPRIRRLAGVVIAVTAGVIGALGAPTAAQTARDGVLRQRVRQILSDSRYQPAAPVAADEAAARARRSPAESPRSPTGAEPAPEADAGRPGGTMPPQGSPPLPEPVEPAPPGAAASVLARIVLYGIAGLCLGLLAIWLARVLAAGRRRPGLSRAAEAEVATGGEERRQAPPGDADRLAAQGRYGEAVHALLLLAIEQVARRSNQGLPPSCTSRELVRQLPLRESARAAFAELVAAVEVSLFGGLAAGATDYARGLRLFGLVVGPATGTPGTPGTAGEAAWEAAAP